MYVDQRPQDLPSFRSIEVGVGNNSGNRFEAE